MLPVVDRGCGLDPTDVRHGLGTLELVHAPGEDRGALHVPGGEHPRLALYLPRHQLTGEFEARPREGREGLCPSEARIVSTDEGGCRDQPEGHRNSDHLATCPFTNRSLYGP